MAQGDELNREQQNEQNREQEQADRRRLNDVAGQLETRLWDVLYAINQKYEYALENPYADLYKRGHDGVWSEVNALTTENPLKPRKTLADRIRAFRDEVMSHEELREMAREQELFGPDFDELVERFGAEVELEREKHPGVEDEPEPEPEPEPKPVRRVEPLPVKEHVKVELTQEEVDALSPSEVLNNLQAELYLVVMEMDDHDHVEVGERLYKTYDTLSSYAEDLTPENQKALRDGFGAIRDEVNAIHDEIMGNDELRKLAEEKKLFGPNYDKLWKRFDHDIVNDPAALEKMRQEQERQEQERLERERLRQERLERERLERERHERERLKKEQLEKERLKQEEEAKKKQEEENRKKREEEAQKKHEENKARNTLSDETINGFDEEDVKHHLLSEFAAIAKRLEENNYTEQAKKFKEAMKPLSEELPEKNGAERNAAFKKFIEQTAELRYMKLEKNLSVGEFAINNGYYGGNIDRLLKRGRKLIIEQEKLEQEQEPEQVEPKQEEPKQEPKKEEPKQEPKKEESKPEEQPKQKPKQKEAEIAPSNQLQAAEDMVEKLKKLRKALDGLYGDDLEQEVKNLPREFNDVAISTKPTEDYIDACRHIDRFLEKKLKNGNSILKFAEEHQDMGPVLEAVQQARKFRSPRPEDIKETLSKDPYAEKVSEQLPGNNITAARWIEGYKAELRDNLQNIRSNRPDYPEAYVARIMAARELSNSVRGKASTLKTTMTAEEINMRAAQIMSTDSFRIFAERIKKDDVLPKVEAIFAKKHSHGGELDDLFRDFLKKRPAGKLQNNDQRLERWMPTVKERIESLQQQAKERMEGKRVVEADVSKEAYEINLLRAAAGVKRGGNGLDKKIPYVDKGVQAPDLVEELDEKTSQHLSDFRKKFAEKGAKKHILSGHGGKMMESVNGKQNKSQKTGGPQVL